jgi:hypothetical protein
MRQSNIGRWIVLAAGLLLLATVVPLSAQTPEEAADALQEALVTPAADAPIRSSVPVFFLSGNTTKTQAQVQGGFRVTDDPTFGRVYATLGLAAALSGDEGSPTVFGGQGGLANGTTLSLSVTGQRWRWTSTAAQNTAWCKRKIQQRRAPAGADCDNFDLTEVVAQDESLEREFYQEVSTDQPVLYEVSASYTPLEMGYLEEGTFLPASLERGSGALGASIGRFLGNQLWSVGYQHEVAYRQGSQAEICVPAGEAGALRCRKAPLGRPVRVESGVAMVQGRGYLRPKVAWNPRFTYRTHDEEWGIEVPLYVIPGESGLIGGIAPGYNSARGNWTFTVFIGRAFRVGL